MVLSCLQKTKMPTIWTVDSREETNLSTRAKGLGGGMRQPRNQVHGAMSWIQVLLSFLLAKQSLAWSSCSLCWLIGHPQISPGTVCKTPQPQMQISSTCLPWKTMNKGPWGLSLRRCQAFVQILFLTAVHCFPYCC